MSNGQTTGCTDRIEQLRPKSPPPKSGARGGRGGAGGKRRILGSGGRDAKPRTGRP